MLEEKRYTLSELSSTLAESTKNEFNPKIGPEVKKEKEYNEKAVSDIMRETSDYNNVGQVKRTAPPEDTRDMNGKTTDYRFVTEPDDRWKERNKALVHGYASKDNEENSDADKSGADFEGNKKIYDKFSELSDKREEVRYAQKVAGLKTREEVKQSDEIDDMHKSKTGYTKMNESMKRLHFKNTKFLSEAHMLKKVPDDYKYDGNRFIMRDAEGTDYLVECSVDDEFNYVSFNVSRQTNKDELNEQLDRMRSLYNYDRSDFSAGTLKESRRSSEDFAQMMEIARNIGENKD